MHSRICCTLRSAFVLHKGFDADLSTPWNRPTHETNADFYFHQKFRNLPKKCAKIQRVRNSGCCSVTAPWYAAPDLARVNFPSPPSGGQGHRKNRDGARGNSYQRSMSVLIPQECKSRIDMAFMTTSDKPRLLQTAWLLLIPLFLSYLLVDSCSNISVMLLFSVCYLFVCS